MFFACPQYIALTIEAMGKRVVLREAQTPLQVEEYQPKPPISGFVQVRNHWTSLNHLDWKRIEKNLFITSFPHGKSR